MQAYSPRILNRSSLRLIFQSTPFGGPKLSGYTIFTATIPFEQLANEKEIKEKGRINRF